MRIVGVDPGLNITGYAVVERQPGRLKLIEAGMIRGRSRGDLAARLQEIHEGIRDVIAALTPGVLAIE
jgi:crossover junction endodeoxyribonuclease RuvC